MASGGAAGAAEAAQTQEAMGLTDGSCIRLRPMYKDHVWSYDFVSERTHDGRPLKLLTIIDEYTRECLAIKVKRKLDSHNVIEQLADLFITRGLPKHIRSDNVLTLEVKSESGRNNPLFYNRYCQSNPSVFH